MFKFLLPTTITLIFLTMSAHAFNSQCNTLTECWDLRGQLVQSKLSTAEVDAKIQSFFGAVVTMDSKSRGFCADEFSDPDFWFWGTACLMTQANANRYCSEQGLRLPTAREFAQLATTNGAVGFLYVLNDGYSPKNYPVTAIGNDGSQDKFRYNYAGYQRPSDETRKYSFWSSSIFQQDTSYAYRLGGAAGDLGRATATIPFAVRCITE